MDEDLSLQMKLLSGSPILVDDIEIKPLTLREISTIGYLEFQRNINILLLTIDDIIDSIDNFEAQAMLKAEKHKYKTFDLYMGSEGLADMTIESLKMLFRTANVKVYAESDEYSIIIDEKYVVNRDNFDRIVSVVEKQNQPNVSGEKTGDEYNPGSELARRTAEKLKKSREIVEKSKSNSGESEGSNIIDIISAVSAMSNSVNKLNIWEYTIYQLHDDFARLNKIDRYKMQIQASMMASDIEIEHWSEPL